MTNAQAKKELNSYNFAINHESMLEIQIKELKRLAEGNGGMTISETPGCSGGLPKQMKDYLAEALDLERKLMISKVRTTIIKADIELRIHAVFEKDPKIANVLEIYFLPERKDKRMTIEEVGRMPSVNYSYSQVKRMLVQGITIFSETKSSVFDYGSSKLV